MPRLKLDTVQIRLTANEKEILKKLADRENMSLSGYIRYLIAQKSVTL
jgi:hypothetical protein